MSPFQALTGQVPDLRSFLPFGTAVYVHRTQPASKLEDRGRDGLYVGHNMSNDTSRVYFPDTRSLVETRQLRPFTPPAPPAAASADDAHVPSMDTPDASAHADPVAVALPAAVNDHGPEPLPPQAPAEPRTS